MKVSVIIAARNEEDNIDKCLASLVNQKSDIPYDVLVGNDNSTDSTYDKIKAWTEKFSNIKLFNITQTVCHQKGKANVLVQLARQTDADYLLFTDADTVLNENWISSMTKVLAKSADLVAGVTMVGGKNFFSKLQKADLIFLFFIGHYLETIGKSTSPCGNNMGIRKSTYDKIGGYENIPFSIVEDFALLKVVEKNGYKFKSCFSPSELAITEPMTTLKGYCEQRKRWFYGGLQLPANLRILLYINYLFSPTVLTLAFLNPEIFGILYLAIWLFYIIILLIAYAKLKQKPGIEVFIYLPYTTISSICILLYYFLGPKVMWKDRKY